MPRYIITAEAKELTGSQVYEVDADNPQEALQKAKDGNYERIYEELEVQEVEWPNVDDIEEVEPEEN